LYRFREIDREGRGGRLSKQYKGKVRLLERKVVMILDAKTGDLVDTIEHQLKNIAMAEDKIKEKLGRQPKGTASFKKEIKRLREILKRHDTP
jgi:hypothetical protein